MKTEKILVIRLGALGDFVLSLGPFKAIRDHHPGAEITLLTTPLFREMAEASGYFNAIWTDGRPKTKPVLWTLIKRLRSAGFSRVYDLQTSDRSSSYFHALIGKRPEWSGIALGASHRHNAKDRTTKHTIERQRDQLRVAGIPSVPLSDLSWADASLDGLTLPAGRFALLIPGGSAHRPQKRWPADLYATFASKIELQGVTPVILGTAHEQMEADQILRVCPEAHSLIDQTSLLQIATVARKAEFAVGNDTGPIHLVAAAGCPTLVLFSSDSNPAKVAPRGDHVSVLQRDDLRDLSTDLVEESLKSHLANLDRNK